MKMEVFFNDIKSANQAVDRLKREGFTNCFVDLNEHYIDERNIETNLPGTETSPSLSGLIFKSGVHVVDRSKAPLTAASPMASGMAGFEGIAGARSKVIIETNENEAERIKQIVREIGGELDSPNIETPKGLEDVDI